MSEEIEVIVLGEVVMKAGMGRNLLLAVIVLAGTMFAGQGSAGATAAWSPDHFKVCWDGGSCVVYAEGDIVWGNRTAQVSVHINAPGYNAEARFDAFAGSTKVDSEITFEPGETFVIGDPNLLGGIDRIRTQVCVTGSGGEFGCGAQWNDIRD